MTRHLLPLAPLDVPIFRRTVLALAGAAGLSTACGSSAPAQPVDVGAMGDFPLGTWTLVTTAQAIVAQDSNGFFAYSSTCTHEACTINAPATDGSTLCGCHGSRFDGNGSVLVGPATQPLSHYALRYNGERLIVDPTMIVSATTRLPLAMNDAGTTDADASSDADATPLL